MLEFWQLQSAAFEDLWFIFDLNVEVSPFLHEFETIHELLKALHLLLWIEVDVTTEISHQAWVLPDLIWYSVDNTEL